MAGKVYEIAFEIASNLSSKFKSSFRQASASAEALAESISSISGRAGQIEAIKKMRREVLEGARAYSNARQRATELGRAVGQMTRKNKTLEAALNAEKAALAQLRAAYGSNNAALKSVEYQAAKDRVKQLSDEYAAAVVQSRNLTAEFEAARGACNDAEAALQAQRVALRQAERETGTLGVSTRDLDDETNRLERETRELAERQEQLARSAEVAAARQRRLDTINEGLARTNDRLSRASGNVLTAYGNIISMGTTIAGPLVGAAKAAMDVESAFMDVKKVANFENDGQVNSFKASIEDLAAETGKTQAELMQLAAQYAPTTTADKLPGAIETLAKASVAFGVTGEEAGQMFANIKSAVGLSEDEVAAFADTANFLSNKTGVAASKIVHFTGLVGAYAKSIGLSDKQTAAFGTLLTETGMTAEVAGTAFQAMGRALVKGAGMSKNQADAFRGAGIDPDQLQTDMAKDAGGTIIKTLETIKKNVPKKKQQMFLGAMFGDEAIRGVTLLMDNLPKVGGYLDIAGDAAKTAGSMQNEYNAVSKTTAQDVAKAKVEINNLAVKIGEVLAPYISEAAKVIKSFVKRAAEWVEENKELVITGLKVAAAVGGLIIGLNALAILFNVVIWPAMKLYQGFLLLKKAIFITRGAMVALRSSTLAAAVANKILTARIVAASLGAKMAALPTKLLGIAQKGAAVGARALGLAMKAIPIVALISAFIAVCVYADKLKQGWEWLKAKTLELWNTFAEKFPRISGFVQATFGAIGVQVATVVNIFMELINFIRNIFTGEWDAAFQNLKNIVSEYFEGMKNVVKTILGGIIRMINGALTFTVPDWVPGIGGKTYSTNIPALAAGGITTGATPAIIGEGSEPEAVMPLSKLDNLLSTNGGAGGISINFAPVINVSGGGDVYGEVTRGLEAGRESLKRELERLLRDQRRVSYA